jgi:hypothetical protein
MSPATSTHWGTSAIAATDPPLPPASPPWATITSAPGATDSSACRGS